MSMGDATNSTRERRAAIAAALRAAGVKHLYIESLCTDAAALQVWKDHNGELAALPAEHARLKAAVAARRAVLKGGAK